MKKVNKVKFETKIVPDKTKYDRKKIKKET